ncbi:MAG: hypothetical protein Q9196_000670 [Gyalolechia fulgens]
MEGHDPKPDMRIIQYTVPETNIDIEFVLFLHDPIEGPAFELAIKQGVQRVRDRLVDQGDEWLPRNDDPYFSAVPGKCSIRVSSIKTEGGRSRMTYKTLLAAFLGMWNALYVQGEEWEVSFRIQVAGLTAGHGTVRVPEAPDLRVDR